MRPYDHEVEGARWREAAVTNPTAADAHVRRRRPMLVLCCGPDASCRRGG